MNKHIVKVIHPLNLVINPIKAFDGAKPLAMFLKHGFIDYSLAGLAHQQQLDNDHARLIQPGKGVIALVSA